MVYELRVCVGCAFLCVVCCGVVMCGVGAGVGVQCVVCLWCVVCVVCAVWCVCGVCGAAWHAENLRV